MILVFGRTGQVARALAAAAKSPAEFLSREQADFALKPDFRALIGRKRPSVVINATGYTAVDAAEKESELAMRVNRDAPAELAAACHELAIPFFHFSTDYVFPGTGSKAWRENDPVAPLSVYGRSKAEGEEKIRAACAKHMILRTSWVYAPEGRNFLLTMLRLGNEREKLQVVNDQIGAPTTASVIARATWTLAERIESGKQNWGTYHLVCGGETSWYGFALAIFEEAARLGIPLKVKSVDAIETAAYPTPARRPLNSRLDTTKLRETFDLQLPDWRASLRECLLELERGQKP